MPITLDTDTLGPRDPVAKTAEVGDYFEGAVIDAATIDVRDFATGETETWPDGNAKKQKVITLLVQSCKGHARFEGEDVPVEAGDIVAIFTGSAGFKALREGLTSHGPLNVGDTLRWSLDGTEPAKTKGFHDRKIRTFTITTNDNPQLVAQAEELHLARKQPIALEHDGEWAPGEEPF